MTKTKQPRVKSVAAHGTNTIKVTWKGGGSCTVDLTGLIARVPAFDKLKDAGIFMRVGVIDWGWAVGWPGGLDLSADTVKRMAEEQAQMTGNDLVHWQERLDLTIDETAELLGLSGRTVKNYRRRDASIPSAIGMACRALERDPAAFAAHFRPLRKKAGRPKKVEPPEKHRA